MPDGGRFFYSERLPRETKSLHRGGEQVGLLLISEALVATLALGGQVDVGGVEWKDIALGVGHDGLVDVGAVLALGDVY